MVGPEISRRLPVYDSLRLSYWQSANALMFLGVSMAHNFFRRRPYAASLPKHLIALASGYFVGTKVDEFVEYRRNTQVLILEDYISKHPEDFPVVAPKKYKDVLYNWNPCR